MLPIAYIPTEANVRRAVTGARATDPVHADRRPNPRPSTETRTRRDRGTIARKPATAARSS